MSSYYWINTYYKLHSFITIWTWLIYIFGSVAYWGFVQTYNEDSENPSIKKYKMMIFYGIVVEIVLFVIGVALFIFLPEPSLFR